MTTKLFADLVDFSLELDEDDKIVAYLFRFGKCDDFHETIESFKANLPVPTRKPFPEKKWLWRVEASPKTETAMDKIFDNFRQELDTAKSQLRMF